MTKTKIFKAFITGFVLLSSLFVYSAVSAHEVYVLPTNTIQYDFNHSSPNPFSALTKVPNSTHDPIHDFIFWGLVNLVGIAIFFYASYKGVFNFFTPFLKWLKSYAPTIARVFIGLSFVYGAINKALFGPEIPFSKFGLVHTLQGITLVCGLMLIVGFYSRLAALISGLIFIYAYSVVGLYFTTYINYFAEIILILISGSGPLAIDNHFFKTDFKFGDNFEKKYGGLVLRLGIGAALFWAAINIKFLHAQLSLDVVNQYHLTKYFPFDPLFVVLGSGVMEIMIAVFYLTGFLVRMNTVLFLSFITLSLLYFGEAVWPHIILYGIALAVFAYGNDKYSLQGKLLKQEI